MVEPRPLYQTPPPRFASRNKILCRGERWKRHSVPLLEPGLVELGVRLVPGGPGVPRMPGV